jgi:hypothetical protein
MQARQSERYRSFEASWDEQRQYITSAVQALGDSPLRLEALVSLDSLIPVPPDLAGFQEIPDLILETKHFRLWFDDTGSACIQHLRNQRVYFDTQHPLGRLIYQRFDHSDYQRYFRQYIINKAKNTIWAIPDFTKPWLVWSQITRGEWLPRLERLFRRQEADGVRFVIHVRFNEEPCAESGCPRQAWLEYWLPDDQPEIGLTVQWFDKQAYRGPEALWLTINPRMRRQPAWTLDKLGQPVSPLEVVKNGNRKLHAVGKGVTYQDENGQFMIETLDAPLVAPGKRSLLDFNRRQPAIRQGVHFLLYDNIWGTNFPMWYEEDARFRFKLRFG